MAESKLELTPVRCGCGGQPVVGHIEKTRYLPKDRWYIGCPKCDISTGIYDTETEAITAWNTAMGTEYRTLLRVVIHDAEEHTPKAKTKG